MKQNQPGNRELKTIVARCLDSGDFLAALDAGAPYAERRLVNPLLSHLYHRQALVRWRAVSALGVVTARMADADPESARVIMRRLMWHLNDESGGIGWGVPETMGDIMARQGRLAQEFSNILLSYADPHMNYLEHEGLQPGLMWGIGRLARARPGMLEAAADLLPPYLVSDKADIRGHAAWAAKALSSDILRPLLRGLSNDPAVISLYREYRLSQTAIKDIVGNNNETKQGLSNS